MILYIHEFKKLISLIINPYTFVLLLIFNISILSSCSKQHSFECIINKHLQDTTYGPTASENGMDIYLPGNIGKPANAVIILHGGSWFGGDKSQTPCRIISKLTELGYVVFNINYHLVKGSNNLYPTQMMDIRTVLDTLSARASKYGIQKDQFAIIGMSVGANLGLLYSYAFNDDKRVKTVISFSGPTDFTDGTILFNRINDYVTLYLGAPYNVDTSLWEESSPYWQVTEANGVPTLLFHGDKDALVVYTQSVKLAQKLSLLKVPNQLIIYKGEGHDWQGSSNYDDSLQKLGDWLKQYF